MGKAWWRPIWMSTSKIFHVASTASWLVETVYILPLTFRTLGFSDKKLLEVRDVSLLICTKVCICHKKNLPEGCRHSNQQCIFLDGIEKDEVNSIVHCRALGQEQLFFISRLPINRARLIIITMCQAALSLEARGCPRYGTYLTIGTFLGTYTNLHYRFTHSF